MLLFNEKGKKIILYLIVFSGNLLFCRFRMDFFFLFFLGNVFFNYMVKWM